MTEWQPIKTAPEDGTKILLFGTWARAWKETPFIAIGFYESGGYTEGWVVDGKQFFALKWMPLPPLPLWTDEPPA